MTSQPAASADAVHELSEDACWALLEHAPVGRLGVSVASVLEIFPINIAVEDRRVLFRTGEGTKLAALTIHDRVVLEADDWDADTAWSVMVKGRASALQREADLSSAVALCLSSWIPTVKTRIVEIRPDHVTGRRFRRGPEPEPGFWQQEAGYWA